MKSLVLILPADLRDEGNAISVALGHDVGDGKTYTVPLSASGQEPATHYGCHVSNPSDNFLALLTAAKANQPVPLPPGIDATTVQAVMAALVVSVTDNETDAAGHFDSTAAINGLQRIMGGA